MMQLPYYKLLMTFFISSFLIVTCMTIPAIVESAELETQQVSDDDDTTDGFEEDDSLEGFDESDDFEDVSVDLTAIQSKSQTRSFYTLGGFIKEDLGYSYGHEPDDIILSKIRTTVNLSADFRLFSDWTSKIVWNGFFDYAYENFGREKFNDEILETNESESEIRDLFLDGSVTHWMRFKIGRQIIAWGQSDMGQINDMANPRDSRELGTVDLEDSRIPVTSTKLSFYLNTWELNLVALHEIRGNKLPAQGSEFDIFQTITSNGITVEDEELPTETEAMIRIFKSFNGGDISFIWSDVYSDSPHLDFEKLTIYNNRPIAFSLTPRHKRIQTIGFSGNWVTGSWLFKTELARKSNTAIARSDILTQVKQVASTTSSFTFNKDSNAITPWEEKDLTQWMLGFEYGGFDDITLSLETIIDKVENFEETLTGSEMSNMITLNLSHQALNDLLTTRLVWVRFSENNGDLGRINIDYDLIDALNISGGIVVYEATETTAKLYPYRNNDRLFAALKYSF